MPLKVAVCFFLFAAAPAVWADDHELLNEEERQWLESLREPIIVATEVGYHPYNFVDENGELSGVAGDYMRLLEERLHIDFVVHSYPTFAEVLEAARNRHVDIVPLIVAAPERKSYLSFTQPAYETQDRILTRKEMPGVLTLGDLGGMTIAMVEGYARLAEIEREHTDVSIVRFTTETDALVALSLGEVDAFVTEIGTSSYYIQQEAITNLRVAGLVAGKDEQTMAIRSDWPVLTNIIGKGLASITQEEREAIQRRWINVGGVDPTEINRLWRLGAYTVATIILILGVVLAWTISLQRLVTRRTAQLREELVERRKLEAAKERLAVAVEQSAAYMLVIDTEGHVEYANPAFTDASGIGEFGARSFVSLALNSSRETLAEALDGVAEAGAWRGTVELARGEHGAMKVAMSLAPIFDEHAELDGYVATGRDVTHEEKLESRLRQSEKLSALGTLAGGIAHDFNNLLVPIVGYADLLRKESNKRTAPYVKGIVDASERARDLVRQILIFGRGDMAAREPLDLCVEIGDATALLESMLPANVELHFYLDGCNAVMCDKTQFQQILVNLCGNACDAVTGRGGVIDVRLEQQAVPARDGTTPPDLAPGDYNVITVSDNGDGMDEETIARIFDPYYTNKPHGKGTGLGLAIVHGIVGTHGGAIQVDSTVGEGTVVKIYLPTVEAQPERRSVESRSELRRGQGERILILDDDELALRTIELMVQALGYEASKWSDPHAALRAFEQEPHSFDAILADYKMPGMTGIKFAEQVRAVRAEIPIMIMTGNTGAIEDGSIDRISKPLSLTQLADCLQEFVVRAGGTASRG